MYQWKTSLDAVLYAMRRRPIQATGCKWQHNVSRADVVALIQTAKIANVQRANELTVNGMQLVAVFTALDMVARA